MYYPSLRNFPYLKVLSPYNNREKKLRFTKVKVFFYILYENIAVIYYLYAMLLRENHVRMDHMRSIPDSALKNTSVLTDNSGHHPFV
jgi:hypothetical protein